MWVRYPPPFYFPHCHFKAILLALSQKPFKFCIFIRLCCVLASILCPFLWVINFWMILAASSLWLSLAHSCPDSWLIQHTCKWFLQHPAFPTSGIFSTDDTAFCSTLTIHFFTNILGPIIASNYENFINLILYISPSGHSLEWPIFPAHSGTHTSSNPWSQHGFQFTDSSTFHSLLLFIPLFTSW